MANGYRIEEITTGSGGDAGYGTEYALIDPEGQVVTYIDANRDDFGNILGYHVSNDLGYVPIDLDAINAKAASGVVPFGQGMGPALGYEYGMKNSEGNLFRKFDAQGNLTEFLDQHGQWQPASTFQPAGFEFNPATGNFETSYRSPNSPRANIRESTATTVNPFREDQGGWLGEGGWRNLGMLALSGLSAGLAGAAGGAGIAGGAATGANALENAALLSQVFGGGAGAANTASSVAALLSSPAAQIGLNVADIGSKAYDFLKNNQSFSQQDIERLQAEGESPADLSSLAGYGGLPQPSGAPQGVGGLGSLLSGDQQDKDEDDENKKRKAEDFLGLLSQTTQTNVKTPPVAKIDYMYDIGGDSVFATPKQESLMPSPFEQAPEPVEGAMPRYQYYDPTGGYLYAGGGMVAFEDGGEVTDEELEAAARPLTYNPKIAASGERARENKANAPSRQAEQEDTVVDAYGNVIRFSDYGKPVLTLEQTTEKLTGMSPDVDRSMLLPYNPEAGFHVPEALYSGIKSIMSPEQARKYGNVSDKEAIETALNVMGGGLGASSGIKNATGVGGTDLGMFIGPYSKMWDKKSYERALNLEKMGRTPEEIQTLTGNIKSPSGAWSQMISDKNAIVRPSEMPSIYNINDVGGDYVKVKDVLKHHDLFKAYPDMANLPIVLTPGRGAYFDPVYGVIGLGDKSLSPKEIKEDILHELQHAIQRYEGWPRGGNTEEFKAEMINPSSAFRNNPLGRELAELYDLFVTSPIAMRKYNRLEGEAQARATEKMMESGATQQRTTPLAKQYDVPMESLQVKYGYDYAEGGLIENDYTIEDLQRILGSK